MKDPRDPGTLDLVEACKRPLTGAERQKRRREKLKKLKAAGKLFDLQLTGDEIGLIHSAVFVYGEQSAGVPWKVAECESLHRRLACLRSGQYYEGDPVWSKKAIMAAADEARAALSAGRATDPAPSLIECEVVVMRAALDYYAASFGPACPAWRNEMCFDLWRRLGGLSPDECKTWPPSEERDAESMRAHYVKEREQLVRALEYANAMNDQMRERMEAAEAKLRAAGLLAAPVEAEADDE